MRERSGRSRVRHPALSYPRKRAIGIKRAVARLSCRVTYTARRNLMLEVAANAVSVTIERRAAAVSAAIDAYR